MQQGPVRGLVAATAALMLTGCADWPRWSHLSDEVDAIDAPDDPRELVLRSWDTLVEADDKDNALSVKAAGAKFDAAVAEVREMAKAFGAPKAGSVSEMAGKGARTDDHPAGGDSADMRRLLPSLNKRLSREETAASGKK